MVTKQTPEPRIKPVDLSKERLADAITFINGIRTTNFFRPDKNPKPDWKIFYGDTWISAYNAAHSAFIDAAVEKEGRSIVSGLNKWNASQKSACRAVNEVGKRVSDSDMKFIFDYTSDTVIRALVASLPSMVNVVGDAVNDVALMASLISLSNFEFRDREKHTSHAKERVEVWQKGYGLMGDMDGVLYVYCKEDPLEKTGLLRQ